jgi:hypothetical protein
MSTYAQIVEQTLAEVSAYVRNQEPITVLEEDITASSVRFAVDEVKALSRGAIEIDGELMYLKATDATESKVDIIAGGRGWNGTEASNHKAGAIIRNNPVFPRAQVRRAINDTIKGIRIPVLKNYEFDFDGVTFAYPLPVDADTITGVTWNPPDTTQIWQPLRNWSTDRNFYNDGDGRRRIALVLKEAPVTGRTVRVQYIADPVPLEDGDDFVDSGLSDSCEDVVRLGAMWRLVSTIDPGKLIATTPSADIVDAPVQAGTGGNISRYLYQLYTIRLEEERSRVLDRFQTTINYTR